MKLNLIGKPNRKGNFVNRDEYSVLEVYYSNFTSEMKKDLEDEVKELYQNATAFQANTGNNRTKEIQKVDAFSGVIAEYATVLLFNEFIGNCHAVTEKPEDYTHKGHVDITLTNGNISRRVEVRSSFVNNGIEFALFNTTGVLNGQYFNVIGPYLNKGYKKEYESEKDYYVRVLFDNRDNLKEDYKAFSEAFFADEIPIFIIGAATKKLFSKHGFSKNFNSKENQIKTPGEYSVIELQHIYDINDLKRLIEKHSI